MSFADEDLTLDAFLGGRVRLLQPRRGYRAAADPVFLAAFVPARPGESALDLGCGAGAAALCLAARVPGVALAGLEVQPAYAALARRNAAANGIELGVVEGDVAAMPTALRARHFDHVLMNPPFHAAGGTTSPDPGRARAHHPEQPLAAWTAAALARLRPGGTLAMVLDAGRLGSALAAIEGRAGAAELVPLAPRIGRPAVRVLIRARKGRRSPVVLYPPLTLHRGSDHRADADSYTEMAEKILRDMSALLPETIQGCSFA